MGSPIEPNAIAGTCFVAVAGVTYAIAGQGHYKPSSPKRESLIGQDAYHGTKVTPDIGRISWQGRDSNAVTIGALADLVGVTVTLELANGKTIIGSNMSRVGDAPEVNTEDATFDIKFEGPSVTEN